MHHQAASTEQESLNLLLGFKDKAIEDVSAEFRCFQVQDLMCPPCCVVGVPQAWRRHSNSRFVDWDKFWTVNILVISTLVYVLNWDVLNPVAVIFHHTVSVVLLAGLLHWLQFKHTEFYIQWRIPIVLGVRFAREMSTLLFLRPAVNQFGLAAATMTGASCLRVAFPAKHQLSYVMTRALAYPLPVKLQGASLLVATLSALTTIPERCMIDVTAGGWTQTCAEKWTAGIERVLGPWWVINFAQEPSLRQPFTPMKACLLTQQFFLVSSTRAMLDSALLISQATEAVCWRGSSPASTGTHTHPPC